MYFIKSKCCLNAVWRASVGPLNNLCDRHGFVAGCGSDHACNSAFSKVQRTVHKIAGALSSVSPSTCKSAVGMPRRTSTAILSKWATSRRHSLHSWLGHGSWRNRNRVDQYVILDSQSLLRGGLCRRRPPRAYGSSNVSGLRLEPSFFRRGATPSDRSPLVVQIPPCYPSLKGEFLLESLP